MLIWKKIMERWHLTHDDIAICKLVIQLAQQTTTAVCPACLDALADARVQWLSLN
jgi:hypothetical protein